MKNRPPRFPTAFQTLLATVPVAGAARIHWDKIESAYGFKDLSLHAIFAEFCHLNGYLLQAGWDDNVERDADATRPDWVDVSRVHARHGANS